MTFTVTRHLDPAEEVRWFNSRLVPFAMPQVSSGKKPKYTKPQDIEAPHECMCEWVNVDCAVKAL